MVWLAGIGGRLEDRFSCSPGIVYNTFPPPRGGGGGLKKLEPDANRVLKARENHPDKTLNRLYDPLFMPEDLRKAHERLDQTVDRLYRSKPFKDDHERLVFLLEEYSKMVRKA